MTVHGDPSAAAAVDAVDADAVVDSVEAVDVVDPGATRETGQPSGRPLPPPKSANSFAILRYRDFAIFWFSALISSAGNWMQLIAVPALMYELTHSAAWVGAVVTAGSLPTLFLVPYAGVLADRVKPRPYLAVVQVAQMLVAVALYIGYQDGDLGRWSLIVLIALNGCATGLLLPAWQIFLPQLVPPDRLSDAVRLNSMQFTAARVFGPTTAAIVIGIGSLQLAFLLNALSFVGVLIALIVVRPRTIERHVSTVKAAKVFAEGARYVAARPAIRVAVIIAAASATLGMSLQQQAASIASELYGRASTDNAGLITAAGFGALLAVFLVVTRGHRIPAGRLVLICMAVYAAGSFTMGATNNYVFGLAGFALNGFAMSGTSLTINTTVLTHAEPRFRGRAISFYLLAVMAGIPLGAMALGLVADHFSMRVAVLGMGALMVVQLAFCLATGAADRLDEPPVA